jgi:hypothetical protein
VPTFGTNQAQADLSQPAAAAAAAQIHPTTINEESQVFPLLAPLL